MNKVIIITGGSRGIGAATALLAAEKGFAAGLNYLKKYTAAIEIASFLQLLLHIKSYFSRLACMSV
jgi:NAD(P)-dependent dehydrogenase (short-subunit alcohol dehydrogenase family)